MRLPPPTALLHLTMGIPIVLYSSHKAKSNLVTETLSMLMRNSPLSFSDLSGNSLSHHMVRDEYHRFCGLSQGAYWKILD